MDHTINTARTGQQKAAMMLETLAAGRTIYVCTCTRVTKLRQKDVDKFKAAGYDLIRGDDRSVYVRHGKRWDCIDFANIKVE